MATSVLSHRTTSIHTIKWQFKAAGETMMIENEMFWRDSQYSAIPEGSGADMIEEIKPFFG